MADGEAALDEDLLFLFLDGIVGIGTEWRTGVMGGEGKAGGEAVTDFIRSATAAARSNFSFSVSTSPSSRLLFLSLRGGSMGRVLLPADCCSFALRLSSIASSPPTPAARSD